MSFVTGIFVYFLTFWTVLFAILPFGNQAPEVKDAGEMPGAPANPRIKQKFIATAIVSTIVWLIIYGLIEMNIIDFHEIAMQMIAEDAAQP
jgi:predicted secreted protein